MIVMTKDQYQEILNHSRNTLPNEACGLLGGRIENGVKYVEKVYLLRNIDNSPEHFSMNPREQLAAIKDMRSNGWELLGNFHSHPATPSRPSEEDIRLAFDPKASYMILSLKDSTPVVKSFNISSGQVSEERLSIVGEET
ncbi:M67 family metallopeptidase [Acetivibrio mesophilus]|uniref:M67 family peptidase n=1 Tax=Acetivibrio mesophilus TaxID=2487273 RepID=A0A4V1K1U7_9FIRM|nr:M67 family metallopeptidase [Acetivibrio mesophilus]RXE58029.1 M67 family peptidase [Acetivibrio mesophilus]